nr:PREDICTED: leucine-rich repeat-containing protein 75B [Struthio camelus australis]
MPSHAILRQLSSSARVILSVGGSVPPKPHGEGRQWRAALDLGLEGTFLNEVLYKNSTFLNLVDPISHDLLMSLARDLQCPKKEYDPWKSSDRICRQLIYCAVGPLRDPTGQAAERRPGLVPFPSRGFGDPKRLEGKPQDRVCPESRCKPSTFPKQTPSNLHFPPVFFMSSLLPQGCARNTLFLPFSISLKTSLQKKVSQDTMDLSGIPLTMRDVHRMAYYLQNNGDHLTSMDLSFTELNDDMVRLLLPFLWALPKLTHLSLNGNRLTRATMKELTDAMKDMNKFPCLAWVDLGNNVDVSSMPQPLLVGLRKRLSQQTTLPTIYEALDCDSELSTGQEGSQPEDEGRESTPPRAFPQQGCER